MTATAISIAGSDSGGGAGIQADLKTFSALGVYGGTIVTALTAQNTCGVTAIHDVPADIVTAQIDAVFSDIRVDAVKIGMLSRVETIRAVADGLDRWRPAHVILDPVMVATSGDMLLVPEARDALVQLLFPRATLITPNLAEAAALTDTPLARTEADMRRQGRMLLDRGAAAVLVKGGDAAGPDSIDLLLAGDGVSRLSASRVETRHTHGTGCTLSAAIAAFQARGMALPEAVTSAKDYVTAAIAAAEGLHVGQGRGPVHHFHRWWPAD